MTKNPFPYPKSMVCSSRASCDGHHRQRGSGEHHDQCRGHTMLEFEPPLVGCVSANRNYTFDILKNEQGMRNQHSNSGTGGKRWWAAEYLRTIVDN